MIDLKTAWFFAKELWWLLGFIIGLALYIGKLKWNQKRLRDEMNGLMGEGLITRKDCDKCQSHTCNKIDALRNDWEKGRKDHMEDHKEIKEFIKQTAENSKRMAEDRGYILNELKHLNERIR